MRLSQFFKSFRFARKNKGAGEGGYGGPGNGYVARDAVRQSKKKAAFQGFRQSKRRATAGESTFASWKVGQQGPQDRGVFRKGLVIMALLLLSALAYQHRYYFSNSLDRISYFQVADIQISGNKVTTEALIREAGGLGFHQNLLSVDLETSRRLIEVIDWVKQVELKRQWPDTLLVKVVEYRPVALVVRRKNESGHFSYVDHRGELFGTADSGSDMDYPVVTGLEEVADKEQLRGLLKEPLAFLKLAGRNNPSLPAQNISEININGEGKMVLYLVEYPFPIYIGKGDVRKKYSHLRRVLDVLYKNKKGVRKIEQVAYIHLDYMKNKVLVAQN